MTAREKLTVEHPEKLDDLELGGCMGCPEDYGYLPDADFCTNNYDRYGDLFERCKKCWDREIPEEMKEEKEKFLDAQKAVDGLVVYDKLPDGKLGQIKLRDIGFIKPVELECVHYVYKGSAGVKGGFHA